MRTFGITSLGFGKDGKAFWLLSEQDQPEMEEGCGLLMDSIDFVKRGAK